MMLFDEYLGPYPQEETKNWASLSALITPQVLDQLRPVGNSLWSEVAKANAKSKIEKDTATANEQQPHEGKGHTDTEELLNSQVASHGSRYTEIPNRAFPLGATPQEITKYGLDKSYLLMQLLQNKYNNGTHARALQSPPNLLVL